MLRHVEKLEVKQLFWGMWVNTYWDKWTSHFSELWCQSAGKRRDKFCYQNFKYMVQMIKLKVLHKHSH